MSITFLIILFILGFIGSFVSGMVGVGGAIINYPMILYIPPLLGTALLSPHHVSGIVAVQVFFATLSGVFAYRNGGYLNKNLIIYMGASVLAGSLIGGYGSDLLSGEHINLVYGILAVIAAILILLPKKGIDEDQASCDFNKLLASSLAFIVGIAAGIVGAGGAFLLVPIMLTVLKLPTRVTIATSLAITFLSSVGSAIGKLVTHQILFIPAAVLVVASVIASPLGAAAGKKINTKVLQFVLAALIMITAIKVWMSLLQG
ncbi:hypothetical protein EV207_102295 [Scopulibacillus darangshiensis]|uniref:Probable membrane transporter protein n=1 Tax=Scopulibacillus darangshiensis TaxID=442528 RepID=A0A4R2PA25_9BACL|nr:sulfite exporter TauE/SafE family protein [Scopulibacillus darangshiensis]TCP31802.1 hypothetical protein EV207_102295 [Scopulibacillus darangshiensis]